MAAVSYTNHGRGGLICYDRQGREVYFPARATVVADIDTEHPPIKAWFNEGRLAATDGAAAEALRAVAEARAAAEADAARLEAERLAEIDKAATVEITAGEARPITQGATA